MDFVNILRCANLRHLQCFKWRRGRVTNLRPYFDERAILAGTGAIVSTQRKQTGVAAAVRAGLLSMAGRAHDGDLLL